VKFEAPKKSMFNVVHHLPESFCSVWPLLLVGLLLCHLEFRQNFVPWTDNVQPKSCTFGPLLLVTISEDEAFQRDSHRFEKLIIFINGYGMREDYENLRKI